MKVDLLVIGGGLAGVTAALAARARGQSVALARRSWGATALSTGAYDLAHTPGAAGGVAAHLADIAAHRPRHPFGVIGAATAIRALSDGHRLIVEALAASGVAPEPLDLEAAATYLPSALGALVPVGGAAPAHRGADLLRGGRWGILQVAGLAAVDARRIALGLAHDVASHGGTVPTFVQLTAKVASPGPTPTTMGCARTLDDAAAVAALAQALAPQAAGLDGILAPPCLGLSRHAEARAALAAACGVPVVELLSPLPSVPGVRLQRALDAAVAAAQVAVLGEVVAARPAGSNRLAAVTTATADEIEASAVVLASGRHVGGGIVWRDRCREAIFGLPVATEDGLLEDDAPHNVVRRTPRESHPLLLAGVPIDARCRVLAEGRPAFTNLLAAGAVIGGYASRRSPCADGVALATGVLAAAGAAAP